MMRMKKIVLILTVCFLVVSIAGCGGGGPVYDDDEAIARSGDSGSVTSSTVLVLGDDYTQTAKITGTQTVWGCNAARGGDIKISFSLSVAEGGKAKLVLISPDDEVTILTENKDNNTYTDMQTKTVSIKEGLNRIKVVGDDGPKIELKMHIEEGRFIINSKDLEDLKENR